MSVCCDDGRKRSVRDLECGVDHSEKHIGDRGIKARGHVVLRLSYSGELEEHQDSGDGERDCHIHYPCAVAAVAAGLDGVRYAAHDRVIDAVPHPGEYEHDHDEQRTEVEDVRVEFLQQCRHKGEHETSCGIDHGVTEVVLCLESAGTCDVRAVNSLYFFV